MTSPRSSKDNRGGKSHTISAIRQVSQLSQKEEKGQAERAQTSAEWRNHGVLGPIHNIVIWIRSSDKRYNEFKRRAGRIIPRDNDTRWNSWFMMISVALQLRHKISEYVEDHYNEDNIRLDHLSPNQWQELQELHDFLQPFYEVTKGTQFDDSTLDKVLFDMDYLVSHFKQAMEQYGGNADSTMMERLMVGWYKFDDNYQLTDDSPVYAASLLLHPSLRKRYLTTNWAHQPGFIEPAIQRTRDLWQQYKPTATTAAHLASLTPYQRHERKMYGYDDLKDEFERFIEASPHSIGKSSALDWWLESTQQTAFPNLYRLAINIFSIPPMSAEAERVFSGARRTISWDRVRLSSQQVEYTECLKSWIRSGLSVGVTNTREELDKALQAIEQLTETSAATATPPTIPTSE